MSIVRQRIEFTSPGVVNLVTDELAAPGPGEVLVKVDWSLLSSGTELTCLHQRYAPGTHWDRWVTFPFYPGYSAAGHILEVGRGLEDQWQVGERVAFRTKHASHAVLPSDALRRIPDGVKTEEAAWIGLMKIVQVGARRAEIKLGDQAVVVGCGILGLLLVQYLAMSGCRQVIAVDTEDARLKVAGTHGASMCFQGTLDAVSESIVQACEGEQPDVVIDVTGAAAVLPSCLRLVRTLGRVVLLGDPGDPDRQHITNDIIRRGIQLVGAHDLYPQLPHPPFGPWTPEKIECFALELLADGRLDVRGLVSHHFKAINAQEAYQIAACPEEPNLGILLDWREGG